MTNPGVYRAAIAAASAGDNTLVAAIDEARITVLSFGLVPAGAVSARFESAASGGSALTGWMALAANTPLVAAHEPNGHLQTAKGELLNLELGSGVSVGGWLVYRVD